MSNVLPLIRPSEDGGVDIESRVFPLKLVVWSPSRFSDHPWVNRVHRGPASPSL